MKKIANLILWIVWNAASIIAFPLYALKWEIKALLGCFKEWKAARKDLRGYLMPKKVKEPETTNSEVKES